MIHVRVKHSNRIYLDHADHDVYMYAYKDGPKYVSHESYCLTLVRGGVKRSVAVSRRESSHASNMFIHLLIRKNLYDNQTTIHNSREASNQEDPKRNS